MNRIHAEISEDGKRVEVFFRYDEEIVREMRTVSGARFVGKDQGGPFWRLPLDGESVQELRRIFKKRLILGDRLEEWRWEERRRHDELAGLSAAKDAELTGPLPDLIEFLRPYQRSGAAFIAAADGSLIADQPGLGKTVEVIAGIFEAGVAEGANLVIAPLTSLESVWQRELEKWQPYPVWVPKGPRPQRESVVEDFLNYTMNFGEPGWLVLNPHMIAYRREAPTCPSCGTIMKKLRGESYYCGDCHEYEKVNLISVYPQLHEIAWRNIVIDECHKNAVRNPKTLTARAMFKLGVSDKKIAMSGTPMDVPIHLWGILHWLDSDKFSSKWRLAEQYLEVTSGFRGHPQIGKVRPDRKKAFFKMLNPYVLRRTKAEVLPELPPKVPAPRWVEMEGKQAKQYRQFDDAAWIRIEEEELSAAQVITEFLRLKQFAIAVQRVENGTPYPTTESCKLDAVEELLEERGIFDSEGTEKVVVCSQWERVVDMVLAWLKSKKVPALKLTGGHKTVKVGGKKTKVQDVFQAEGGPRVLVMTTETGGLSIDLDAADTLIFMDETWTASAMEQAEDRLHRASRMHNVTIYTLRTRGTIDEYIMALVSDKEFQAMEIMDKRREVMAE